MNEPVPVMAPSIQADALAAPLTRKGLVTNVYKSRAHLRHPCVRVASIPSPHAVDATVDRIVATLGFPR
jgi:hypothetical protein